MNTNTQIKALLGAVVVMTALGLGTNAYADGGDIGNFFKRIDPGLAVIVDPIDNWNSRTKAFEQAGGQVLNTIIPGASIFMPQGGGVIPVPPRGGFPTPNGGGFVPVQQQQQPMGVFCATSQGVYGPGPAQPIGAPCQANTYWGPMPGRIQ